MRSDRCAGCAARRRAARRLVGRLALSTLLAAAPAAAFAQDAQGPDIPEQAVVTGRDLVLSPPERGSSFFRFLPDGEVEAFDRSLYLSAAPGEERTYLLQTGSSRAAAAEAPPAAYLIDKRRPAAPTAEPQPGLFSTQVSISLSAEAGARVLWALVGPGGSGADAAGPPQRGFSEYSEASPPRISPPSRGSQTYALFAYAVDAAGNRSYPSRFVYRMTEPGLPAQAPAASAPAPLAAAALPAPDVEYGRGYADVRMTMPPDSSFLVDFETDSPPSSIDDFERVEAAGGVAKLRVPCPYAWSGEVDLYYGILKNGAASYNPAPLALKLSYQADERPLPAVPAPPVLAADPEGRLSYLVFPAYDGSVYVSVGSAKPQLYESPIPLPEGAPTATVAWYGEDDEGARSASRSVSLALPELLPDIELDGPSEGQVLGGDATLRPSVGGAVAKAASASIRYELRLDGSLPPEPGPSSPLLKDSLSIPCPAGSELYVVLRYRSFSGATASEGRILRFTLDRKPPEPPLFKDSPAAYSDKPTSVELMPGAGGSSVFASVSADGAAAPFAPVSGPLSLPGSPDGPVGYTIRAYDLDLAGNRSQEMKSFSLLVDRTSLYVAEDGGDKGDGTPDRPYRSLDAALAAAARGGKKNVNLRGSLELRSAVAVSSDLVLSGGFGKAWAREGSARALVRVTAPEGASAVSVAGAALTLRRIELRADDAGPAPILRLEGASLALENSTISGSASGDLVLVSASRSKVALASSSLLSARAMSFTAVSADSSEVTASGSTISAASGVRVFCAADLDGGSLAIRESLLESGADLGLSLLSLRSASLLVDRSLVSAAGGSGFLRLGSFDSTAGEIRNTKLLLSWKGPGTLFESAGGKLAFVHDTIVADSAKGALRFFDAKGVPPRVWNSILDCSAAGSELLRCDAPVEPGTLVADCAWGFDRLVAGATAAADLAALNALNAASALYSSRPSVAEPPEKTFASSVKSPKPLRAGSACVDAAMPLESGYSVDFGGRPRPARPGTAPDIGADELSD